MQLHGLLEYKMRSVLLHPIMLCIVLLTGTIDQWLSSVHTLSLERARCITPPSHGTGEQANATR